MSTLVVVGPVFQGNVCIHIIERCIAVVQGRCVEVLPSSVSISVAFVPRIPAPVTVTVARSPAAQVPAQLRLWPPIVAASLGGGPVSAAARVDGVLVMRVAASAGSSLMVLHLLALLGPAVSQIQA